MNLITRLRTFGMGIPGETRKSAYSPLKGNRMQVENIAKFMLTHCGRVTHICVSKLTIIGSDNGLSRDRRQAFICSNAGLLLIGPQGTNFNGILFEYQTFSFKKMHLKMSSGKRWLFCLGLNVLMVHSLGMDTLYCNLGQGCVNSFAACDVTWRHMLCWLNAKI